MSAFIDAFVIGEGEEVLSEVVDCYKKWKHTGADRQSLLLQLAQIQGVYVPSLYRVDYDPRGFLKSFEPVDDKAPRRILKRIVPKLPDPPRIFWCLP